MLMRPCIFSPLQKSHFISLLRYLFLARQSICSTKPEPPYKWNTHSFPSSPPTLPPKLPNATYPKSSPNGRTSPSASSRRRSHLRSSRSSPPSPPASRDSIAPSNPSRERSDERAAVCVTQDDRWRRSCSAVLLGERKPRLA